MTPLQTIEQFYAAFARLDESGMAACYAEDATFDDEVFHLRGRREVAGMWSMLCANVRTHGRDHWRLQASDLRTAGDRGRAHWEAWYRFTATGRPVHNRIDADFGFDGDGRIRTHRDRFGFWRWSSQALGAPGMLLGWTPWLRARVGAQAARNLHKHLAREAA